MKYQNDHDDDEEKNGGLVTIAVRKQEGISNGEGCDTSYFKEEEEDIPIFIRALTQIKPNKYHDYGNSQPVFGQPPPPQNGQLKAIFHMGAISHRTKNMVK